MVKISVGFFSFVKDKVENMQCIVIFIYIVDFKIIIIINNSIYM